MNDEFSIISGNENLSWVEERIVEGIATQNIAIGADIDGTLTHGEPGEHHNVPTDPILTKLFNNLNIVTNGNAFMLTGRPDEYTTNVFHGRKFLVGTEHGAVISPDPDQDRIYRIGDVDIVSAFRGKFAEIQSKDSSLKGVQIEDYKTVTGTLGFTHVINPEGNTMLNNEQTDLMVHLSDAVHSTAEKILNDLGANDMQIVDTVTPTNAVIEIMPVGACKAESLQYLRDNSFVKSDVMTVFAGDSGGDATVMNKVFNEAGICLGVGPKAPECSHVVFERPENHRAFLAHVLEEAVNLNADLKATLSL